MLKIACIPAFNEKIPIKNLIKECQKYVDKVVVCDDGSDDSTGIVAKELGATVITHQTNLGKGAALRTLFEYSRNCNADIIVTIDGDGQFDPNEIPKLIALVNQGFDIVIGHRFESDSDIPKHRMFGNKILDKMTNLASETSFSDTQSGFRAYSKNAISKIKFASNGFAADSEILINASKDGLLITQTPVKVYYNTGTKTSTKNPANHASEVILSLIELVALKHPLKLLGMPGIVLVAIGIVYSSIVISIFNQTRYFSIPSTLLSLGMLITGLLLILMSMVLFSISRILRK